MSGRNLIDEAASLPDAWRSRLIGKTGGANLKVLRMDDSAYPSEVHAFDEALLVLEGQMNLAIGAEVVTVGPGELYLVPANTPHAVAPGSCGTLLIVDQ